MRIIPVSAQLDSSLALWTWTDVLLHVWPQTQRSTLRLVQSGKKPNQRAKRFRRGYFKHFPRQPRSTKGHPWTICSIFKRHVERCSSNSALRRPSIDALCVLACTRTARYASFHFPTGIPHSRGTFMMSCVVLALHVHERSADIRRSGLKIQSKIF